MKEMAKWKASCFNPERKYFSSKQQWLWKQLTESWLNPCSGDTYSCPWFLINTLGSLTKGRRLESINRFTHPSQGKCFGRNALAAHGLGSSLPSLPCMARHEGGLMWIPGRRWFVLQCVLARETSLLHSIPLHPNPFFPSIICSPNHTYLLSSYCTQTRHSVCTEELHLYQRLELGVLMGSKNEHDARPQKA